MAENILNLMGKKHVKKFNVSKHRTCKRTYTKLIKASKKEKILKSAKEKKHFTYKRKKVRLTTHFPK